MFDKKLEGTPYIHRAMAQLIPRGNIYTLKGDDWSKIEWDENNPDDCPTEDEVATLAEKLRVADVYGIPRKKEYPHWSVQLNKIYDDGIDKWKTEMVDPVKAKYPKP